MCVVSMIGDHYRDHFTNPNVYPNQPWSLPTQPLGPPAQWPPYQNTLFPPVISREEFDALKKDVAEMKELLRKAKLYDEQNGERDCEIDEKMDLLRRVAKLVGVELDDVIKPAAKPA